VEEADKLVERIRDIRVNANGLLACPVLYIGRSKTMNRRVRELLYLAHPANHPLWALLYSGWKLELAFRDADDPGKEENRLKSAYKKAHGRLAPLMER
jgi:hypothetical protein